MTKTPSNYAGPTGPTNTPGPAALSAALRDKIATMVTQAHLIGLDGGLMLGLIDEDQVIVHFDQIKLNMASQIAITAFLNVINQEIAQHPEYPDKYKKIFYALTVDFKKILTRHNKKIMAFNAKLSKQQPQKPQED
jgi:hypothetical protein